MTNDCCADKKPTYLLTLLTTSCMAQLCSNSEQQATCINISLSYFPPTAPNFPHHRLYDPCRTLGLLQDQCLNRTLPRYVIAIPATYPVCHNRCNPQVTRMNHSVLYMQYPLRVTRPAHRNLCWTTVTTAGDLPKWHTIPSHSTHSGYIPSLS
jgi:hypothetical protein